jgi:hypothetical protein
MTSEKGEGRSAERPVTDSHYQTSPTKEISMRRQRRIDVSYRRYDTFPDYTRRPRRWINCGAHGSNGFKPCRCWQYRDRADGTAA